MARSKVSQEEVVMNYFKTAPLEVAGTIFNLVSSELKARKSAGTTGGGGITTNRRPDSVQGALPIKKYQKRTGGNVTVGGGGGGGSTAAPNLGETTDLFTQGDFAAAGA